MDEKGIRQVGPDLASSRSSELSELFIRQATLEDVFLKLTGKKIRD